MGSGGRVLIDSDDQVIHTQRSSVRGERSAHVVSPVTDSYVEGGASW